MSNAFKFTTDQQAAIDSDSNMVITACPGSGKTSVIVEKIKNEIPKLEDFKGVIGITFTVKASKELKKNAKKMALTRRVVFLEQLTIFA